MRRLSIAPDEGPVPQPILPWLEMGAYEVLFLRGMTFKKIADLFREYPDGRSSEFVPSGVAERCAEAVAKKVKDAGGDRFGLRIKGAGNYPLRLHDARNPSSFCTTGVSGN